MTRRVVITGIGMVTPVGATTSQSWDAVSTGRSGIDCVTDERLSEYPIRIAGLVTGEQGQLDQLLSVKDQHRADRFIHLGLIAGTQAVADAGITFSDELKLRTGVYVGVSMGGVNSIITAAQQVNQQGLRRVSPYLIPKSIANQAASALSIRYDLRGPAMSVSSACSSGADAIGQAYRAIMSGHCDVMLAGGTESVVDPMVFAGFGNMRALAHWPGDPTEASRPFDAQRCGFVMAEGAGMLMLEERLHAQRRGATIYAELMGYGATLMRIIPLRYIRRVVEHAQLLSRHCFRPRLHPTRWGILMLMGPVPA